ncbi:MAG: hypothetical protein IJ002_00460 [Clostridia bacterium]|nr:hypothetical protein [Clostridia bacterium]
MSFSTNIDIRSGETITVEFDRPAPLQIDGETVLGVTSYIATAPKRVKNVSKITV